MRKAIKIGFPILCVMVIGGTFILLNKTTERINKNRLKEDDVEIENVTNSTVTVEVLEDNENSINIAVVEEDEKVQEVKNKAKAIEVVKKLAPQNSNCYYTNEGMAEDYYLVAIRDNDTKEAKIYYSVDIQNEKIEIYVK